MKFEQYFQKIIENKMIEGGWLFLGIDEEFIFEKVFDLVKKITNFQFVYIVDAENSINETIRNNFLVFNSSIQSIFEIQKSIYLSSEEEKIVIIKSIDHLSEEAQNALLKITEEPPKNTVLFYISKDEGKILPTLLSRVKIIKLPITNDFYQKRISEKMKETISSTDSLKIYLDEFLEDDPVVFLENLVVLLRDQILNFFNVEELKITNISGFNNLKNLNQALKTLEGVKYANLNSRLQIENLLLNINKN
ncbi:MAG TPA: hypothetical protein PK168_00070 [Candidatus Paceibacterota bacterium]|jgi:hypothetical protein|nr:hypothetical protein [Parcubacteria group bacterium]HOM32991.1 hypothetical protein [Candidatus Paceibacterota bacterium]HPC37299.1 hypothetical protein [Candidatus Paceibacterota bacterium]HRU35844.1 hypothetical protein [Candidatus Paceibacterota bacterium]